MSLVFEEKCARIPDGDLVGQLHVAIEARWGYPLTADCGAAVAERVVWSVMAADGFIAKEGLERFLESEFDLVDLEHCYESLGLHWHAHHLRTAIALFPEPAEVGGGLDLERVFGSWERAEEVLKAPAEMMLDNLELSEGAVARFVRSNIGAFARYDQEIRVPSCRSEVGELQGVWSEVSRFADENDGRIPTLDELRAREVAEHGELETSIARWARDRTHRILLEGRLGDHAADSPLAVYERPIFGVRYCVCVDGSERPYD